ncbi:MAG: M48 family metalloprotease, partial [Gammaproteobacteria bacterium]|nr:M48 family metalloprotease [Gammaproteobacteria bacterium]
FNGDMRINIRLIGVLYGITVISTIGYHILRSSGRSRGSSKNGGGIVILGIGLMTLGYAGTFFGSLIKAAVSRQREFLADASAVQFTRNPDGIAGALKRIGGDATGSQLDNADASEISHALFSQGFNNYFEGLFATHPPLDVRIRKIDPHWDGKFEYTPVKKTKPVEKDSDTSAQKKAAVMAGVATVLGANAAINSVGQADVEHLNYAHELIGRIPQILLDAAHEPCGARALIYFMVLDKDEVIRKKQLHHLMAHADPGAYRETVQLSNKLNTIDNSQRLALIDMALSSLRQLSNKQYQLFKRNLDALIKMDEKISLSEWILQKIVTHHLGRVFEEKRSPKEHHTLKKSGQACAVLLSTLVYSGKQQNISPDAAFETGRQKLDGMDIRLLDKSSINLNALNQALDQLVRLKPLEKPALLKACAACITADNHISNNEGELFRAIADTLDCPMPPLVV